MATTELDDFEPPSSELLRPFSSQKTGVGRGQYERDQFVARTQKWIGIDPARKATLFQFLNLWEKKVDAKNPRIICVNQIELDQVRSLLENLGIDVSQLGFYTHGDPHNPWLESVALKHAGTTHSVNRASRGSHRVLVTEVSIAVKQKAGQQVPDGRDFHRALIALGVAIAVL